MNLKERINSDFMIAYTKDMNKKTFLGILKGTLQTQETKENQSYRLTIMYYY
jgi:hypothetical protein